MDCEKYSEQLSLYVDRELSIDEARAVEAHIQACDNCQKKFEILIQTVQKLKELDELDVPYELSQSLHTIAIDKAAEEEKSIPQAAIRKISNNKQDDKFFTPFARALIALGAVAIIAIAFAFSQLLLENQMQTSQKVAYDNKQTARDTNANADINKQETAKPREEDAIEFGGKNKSYALSSENSKTDNSEGAVNATDKLMLKSESAELGNNNPKNINKTELNWPKVLASKTNYNEKTAEKLLNDIVDQTNNLYTVKDAKKEQKKVIDEIAQKITYRGGNGEVMKKPLDALLNETRRAAMPVYMEKAKFKGVDCWLIITRWGFGADTNTLNNASLYITDLTGWKVLDYLTI